MNAAKALLASSLLSTSWAARSDWITAPSKAEFDKRVVDGLRKDANYQRLDYYITEDDQVMTLIGSYSLQFTASTKPAESTDDAPNT